MSFLPSFVKFNELAQELELTEDGVSVTSKVVFKQAMILKEILCSNTSHIIGVMRLLWCSIRPATSLTS
jgi:hypothetical protein